MLSQDTAFRLDHAVTDDKVGDEIAARLIDTTPANAAAAQAILDILDLSDKMEAQIAERLFVGLAGDANGRAGRELAQKINGMVSVLQAKANGNEIPAVAATASLNLTTDIILTSVAVGAARNTNTFTLQVVAPAANPTDTVLAVFTGTAAAIVCTITPNDGTNNALTPVNLTTAELRELINTGVVIGKNVTVTDASSLRNDQTATGGDATVLADAGEGDGVVATFSGGVTTADTDIAPAKIAMGSEHMSSDTLECLAHALGSRPAAEEMRNAYNLMVDAVQAIA